jgi:hypothetical protein
LLTNVNTNNLQTQLVTKDQHAFEQDSNAKSLNNKSLYITELDYSLLTEKKVHPKLGLMQVQVPRRKVVQCDHCSSEMELQEGTVIYNKQWFHDTCWQSITTGDQNVS